MSKLLGALMAILMLPAIVPAASSEEPSPRLKLAQELARAHASWAPGKQWLAKNHARAAELMVPVLQRCVEDVEEGELMSFSTYLRLSQKGNVLEIVTELDAQLGRCMTEEARNVQLPQAPREDFWIQVNLAAML